MAAFTYGCICSHIAWSWSSVNSPFSNNSISFLRALRERERRGKMYVHVVINTIYYYVYSSLVFINALSSSFILLLVKCRTICSSTVSTKRERRSLRLVTLYLTNVWGTILLSLTSKGQSSKG